MSAASAARRVDPALSITVLESGPFPSYGVCGLPYYLSGVVAEAASLVAYPIEEFRDRRGIDVRLDTDILGVDLDRRTVETTVGPVGFDRLVVATGASPIVPAVPGVDDRRVVAIRRLDDAIRLRAALPDVRRAVVVGAGYVGLEMAESLAVRGIQVTVADQLDRILTTVDESIAAVVQTELEQHVRLLLGAPLSGIEPGDADVRVHLATGESIETDLVVLALGVRPRASVVAAHGALVGPAGALVVDDRMRTSLPGVLAAGDCVALHHRVLGAAAFLPLGPAANKSGRVAGTVAAGGDAVFPGVLGTAVVKVFGLTVAHTGLTVEQAGRAGIDATATEITAKSRAKYYPGAEPMIVRLVHTTDGRLLGAQLVGRDGVAQRIDTVAAALHTGMTVTELADLDLAYAPPFSPVYDPITQAGQAASWRLAALA